MFVTLAKNTSMTGQQIVVGRFSDVLSYAD